MNTPQSPPLSAFLLATDALACLVDAHGQPLQASRAFQQLPAQEDLLAAAARAQSGDVLSLLAGQRPIDWHVTVLAGGQRLLLGSDAAAQRRDALALRKAKVALQQAQKMEALGHFASGIVHDINNLLQVISGHAALAHLTAGDIIVDEVEATHAAVEQARQLTRRLLRFSQRVQPVQQAVVLDEVLAESRDMIASMLRDGLTLRWVLGAGRSRVRLEPGSLGQLTMNLVLNARDALGGDGAITVTSRTLTIDAPLPPPAVGAPTAAGPYAVVEVADDGCGMSADVLANIFAPFYTTKPRGRGTGLGLAVCADIVTRNGASLYVRSEAGHGTVFRVFFPQRRTAP